MGNHHHFVLQTERANLSALMRRVNTLYGQAFNRRHRRHGHVFDGRFKAVLVDRDAYLLQVCRYVDLNPVRAGLVESPEHWRWSTYRADTGRMLSPSWLGTAELHGVLMGQLPQDASQVEVARCRRAEWVEAGRGALLWKTSRRHGLYLGDEAFVERVRLGCGRGRSSMIGVRHRSQIAFSALACGDRSARSATLPDPSSASPRSGLNRAIAPTSRRLPVPRSRRRCPPTRDAAPRAVPHGISRCGLRRAPWPARRSRSRTAC
jgi:hypothetical protein